MRPSLDDGSSEPPSSIAALRLERFKQVAAQPGMFPVLDCLDSLDFALQRVNEEPYCVHESERMRLKAVGAVRTKWPGREGDRGPLEETALQSVASLKVQLTQQMEQHPWLREAIGGDDLLRMVHGIAGHGPFKREDASLREAIRVYVADTLENIYKDMDEAKRVLNSHKDKEDRFSGHIREVSETLSSGQFLHNRAAAEEFRTQVAVQLLSHFVTKAKIAAKRSGRIEDVLGNKLEQFNEWHEEEDKNYDESETEQQSTENKLQAQLSQLQDFGHKHIEEHKETLEKLQTEEATDLDELKMLRQKLEAIVKSVGSIAMRHQRRCVMRSEKERLFRYVQQALKEQEAMLHAQLDLARTLLQRWRRGRELHGQFAELVRKAYDGMLHVAKQGSEDLRNDLQIDSCKFAALARATEDDLRHQHKKMLVALQKTFTVAKKQEEQLELLERSFKPEAQTQQAQDAFQESQESVKRQEEQVDALNRLRETLVSKCEEYEDCLRELFLREPCPESAEEWLSNFFFTARRSRLRVPHALCSARSLPDLWQAERGEDHTLRQAASDPATFNAFASSGTLNAFASSAGSTDLLAIRDGCAWSASEEALSGLEDVDI